MTEDSDIEAALSAQPPVSLDRALARMVDNLAPLIEVVREVMNESPLFGLRIDGATPEQRQEIVRLRQLLAALDTPLQIRLRQLDEAVKIAGARTGADTFPVSDTRAIGLERPQQKYVTEEAALREELVNLIPEGVITLAEINRALAPLTIYKPDHRALNALRDHRGELVAAAIAKHRRKPPLDPGQMRVSWPPMED